LTTHRANRRLAEESTRRLQRLSTSTARPSRSFLILCKIVNRCLQTPRLPEPCLLVLRSASASFRTISSLADPNASDCRSKVKAQGRVRCDQNICSRRAIPSMHRATFLHQFNFNRHLIFFVQFTDYVHQRSVWFDRRESGRKRELRATTQLLCLSATAPTTLFDFTCLRVPPTLPCQRRARSLGGGSHDART
jgi:hypothetical protein